MKMAALERTKFTAKRTLGGAALGAGAGAAINALRGEDWRSGALAGAGIGGALGTAVGAHRAQMYHEIGKGAHAEGRNDAKSHLDQGRHVYWRDPFNLGMGLAEAAHRGEIHPDDLNRIQQEELARYLSQKQRYREIGRSQK